MSSMTKIHLSKTYLEIREILRSTNRNSTSDLAEKKATKEGVCSSSGRKKINVNDIRKYVLNGSCHLISFFLLYLSSVSCLMEDQGYIFRPVNAFTDREHHQG